MNPSIATERRAAPNSYDAPSPSASLLAAALESTINGRPLPDALRPSPAITNPPVQPFERWVR